MFAVADETLCCGEDGKRSASQENDNIKQTRLAHKTYFDC